MNLYVHLCGYSIYAARRWDGLEAYLEYRDGAPNGAGEMIRHCPRCSERLTPGSIYQEREGPALRLEQLLKQAQQLLALH